MTVAASINSGLPDTATHNVALENIAADKEAVDKALRALWPRLREGEHGPLMCVALPGLLDALATLEHAKVAIKEELTA